MFLSISELFLNYRNLLMHNEMWVQMVWVHVEQMSTLHMYNTWNLKHNSQRLFPMMYAVCCCCCYCQPFSCWLCRKAHGNRIANALTAECLVECRMCRKTFNKSRDWPCALCCTHTHFHDLWLPSNQNYDKYCQRHNRPGIWWFYLIKKLYRLSFDSFLPSSAFPAVSAAYSIL